MRILLTGAEGMVGSHLTEYLTERGYTIIPFKGDITEVDDWLKPNYQWIDAIVHLAALAGVRPSIENPELYYNNNVGGTDLMLEFARQNNIQRVLYASSSNAAEWWTNPYGTTKKMNEIQAQHQSSIGMRFHTIWPGRDDMLYKKLERGEVNYINANHYRDMVHVEDVCSAIQILLEKFDLLHRRKVVDIGTGETISVADIAKRYGYEGEYVYENPEGERVETQADIKWLTDLGWKPKWNILDD